MCYITIISTTLDIDLTVHNNDLVKFSKALPGVPEEKYLAHPFKWYLGSRTGCGCGFRHLHPTSVSLGFGEPEEWSPEEPSDVEATKHIAAIIRSMVVDGGEVDCLDIWAHGQEVDPGLAGEIEINLSDITDAAFRFYERHRFTFVRQR